MTPDRAPERGGGDLSAWFWIELREPGCYPERKGRFRCTDMARILREFFAARPGAYMTVVTVNDDGPWFEDAPEALSILDGRSASVARRHRASTRAAFAAYAAKASRRAEDDGRAGR